MRKWVGLYIVLFLIPLGGMSQNVADSLVQQLEAAEADTSKIKIQVRISEQLATQDPASAYDYAIAALDAADSLGNQELAISAANQVAISYYYRGDLDAALRYLDISLEKSVAIQDSMRIANCINNIGVISYDQGALDVALENYLKSLELKERLDDTPKSIAMTLNNIGNVYKDLGEFEASLEYYNRSLALKKEESDFYGEAMTLNNIGLLNHDAGNYEEALNYYGQSILIKKRIDDLHGLAMTINNIGLTYEATGQYDMALEKYEEANNLRVKIGDDFGRVNDLMSMAKIYREREDFDRAIFYAENALQLAMDINVKPHIRDANLMLAELNEAHNRPEEALYHYKAYASWKDSVTNQEAQESLNVMTSRKQVADKAEQVEALEDKTNYYEIAIRRQHTINIILIIGGAVIIAFLVLFFIRLRKSRKISEHLKELSIVASETDNYVLITDDEDQIVWVNKGFERITGYTMEEVKGLKPKAFLRGEATNIDQATEIDKAFEGRSSRNGEILNYRKDGRPVWLSYNASPVLNDKGEIEKFVTIGTEITKEKEAQEKLNKYSASLEVLHSIDGILLSDRTENEVLSDTIRLIIQQIPYCDRLAFFSFTDNFQHAEYLVSDSAQGSSIKSAYIDIKNTRIKELIADGTFHLEQNLLQVKNPSKSDLDLIEKGIVTYIAYPLKFNNEIIACLYLGSRTPNVFTMSDVELISEISKTLAIAITQKKFQKEIKEKNKNITSSLNYAWRIQKATLPDLKELKDYLNNYCLYYLPRDIVSGDFYWFGMKNEVFILAVADCTGHGVPGGFMTMMGINLLNNIVNEKGVTDPSLILTYLHVGIMNSFTQHEEMNDGMDIAIMAFEPDGRTLKYAGARRPIYRVRNGEMETWTGAKMSIGEQDLDTEIEFVTTDIDIDEGDAFYTFSDGITDQFGGPNGKKLGRRRLEDWMQENAQLPMHEQQEKIDKMFTEWLGKEDQVDDVVFMGFRI